MLICLISSRSRLTQGLPDFPALLLQRQYNRKPFRCHAITVSTDRVARLSMIGAPFASVVVGLWS
jgi:hypothetical protein